MGTFSAKVKLASMAQPGRSIEIEALVDTGASFSWIGREKLESLGIHPISRIPMRMITRQVLEREVAPVVFSADGRSGGDTVVVAEPGEMEVIGAHTLQTLSMIADVVQEKLVPTIALALCAKELSEG